MLGDLAKQKRQRTEQLGGAPSLLGLFRDFPHASCVLSTAVAAETVLCLYLLIFREFQHFLSSTVAWLLLHGDTPKGFLIVAYLGSFRPC